MHDHPTHEAALETISFFELWQPGIFMLTLVLTALYLLLTGPFRHRFAQASKVSMTQKLCFISGLMIFFIAQGSPLNYFGHHYLFSAHMLQMALMYLIMPPLILLGIPTWIYRLAVKTKQRKKAAYILTHPLVSMILFNMLFSFYHLPFIFDTVMGYLPLHYIYHSILTLGAILMWFPLINPLKELFQLSELKKIGYIFINSVLFTPVCALIIFANHHLYASFANVPQLISFLPSLDDQQLGGVLMKVLQEVIFVTAITIIFFKWAKKEKKEDASQDEHLLNLTVRRSS